MPSHDIQSLTEAQVRRVLERLHSLNPSLVQSTISSLFEEDSDSVCDSVVTQRVSNTRSSAKYKAPVPPHAQAEDEEDKPPPPLLLRSPRGDSGDLQPVVASHTSGRQRLSARGAPSTGDLKPGSALDKRKEQKDTRAACYLVEYDRQTGQLLMYYSLNRVERAIGVFYPGPGHKIEKYGRSPIVGVSDTQQNYCSGWCQFVLAAKALGGSVTVFPPLTADLYLYSAEFETIKVIPEKNYEISAYLAVACLPKDTPFGTGNMDLDEWVAKAKLHGASNPLQSASNSENIGLC